MTDSKPTTFFLNYSSVADPWKIYIEDNGISRFFFSGELISGSLGDVGEDLFVTFYSGWLVLSPVSCEVITMRPWR